MIGLPSHNVNLQGEHNVKNRIEDIDTGLQVFRLTGALDGLTYLDLHKVVTKSIENGTTRIVLDMGEVDFTSSGGLRAMLMSAKALKEQEGELVLFGMNSGVKEVFKLSGFDTMFKTFESENEALDSL